MSKPDPTLASEIAKDEFFQYLVHKQIKSYLATLSKWTAPLALIASALLVHYGFGSFKDLTSQVKVATENVEKSKTQLQKLDSDQKEFDSIKKDDEKQRQEREAEYDKLVTSEIDVLNKSAEQANDLKKEAAAELNSVQLLSSGQAKLQWELKSQLQQVDTDLKDADNKRKDIERDKGDVEEVKKSFGASRRVFDDQSKRLVNAQSTLVVMGSDEQRQVELLEWPGALPQPRVVTLTFKSGKAQGGNALTICVKRAGSDPNCYNGHAIIDPKRGVQIQPIEGTDFSFSTLYLHKRAFWVFGGHRFFILNIANRVSGQTSESFLDQTAITNAETR